jgi:hypothetical protein
MAVRGKVSGALILLLAQRNAIPTAIRWRGYDYDEKRILLEWDHVEDVQYYHIYAAESVRIYVQLSFVRMEACMNSWSSVRPKLKASLSVQRRTDGTLRSTTSTTLQLLSGLNIVSASR